MKLEGCIRTNTCLPITPKVVTVKRGSSANIYLENAAFRTFLNSKFKVSPVDMESAAIALIAHQQKLPFIAFRALSDLAGERSTFSNGGDDSFTSLITMNCISVVLQFIKTMDRPMVGLM
ncbi:bark storage protein B-like [Magnolia sinica]|uniref:bark storage protein B-like n=1 Tax=Magnolia sinica TaxID=86752 RepID=UPI002657F4F1|nr:bark storage protein B-like [Magnolia sinica]